MAIPSGSGTEVLKRKIINGLDSNHQIVITGLANHIYTIISIIACNRATTSENLYIVIDPDSTTTSISTASIYPFKPANVASDATFVMNDRFVISGIDKLYVDASTGSDWDIVCTYIDQDWTTP